MPSAVGYQPTLAAEMGALQERITTTKTGSITSVQAVFVPADDYTDPSPATTFAHLDSSVVLSRAITDLGIYPAVDPLASSSRQLDPNIVGQARCAPATSTRPRPPKRKRTPSAPSPKAPPNWTTAACKRSSPPPRRNNEPWKRCGSCDGEGRRLRQVGFANRALDRMVMLSASLEIPF